MHDLRLAIRAVWASPVVTAAAVLSLALRRDDRGLAARLARLTHCGNRHRHDGVVQLRSGACRRTLWRDASRSRHLRIGSVAIVLSGAPGGLAPCDPRRAYDAHERAPV